MALVKRNKMGVLSEQEITHAVQNGKIMINPFKPENLNSSSYNVTLGRYFYRMFSPDSKQFYNPFSKSTILEKWNGFHRTCPVKEFVKFGMTNVTEDNINFEKDEGILLNPGESILTHTQEFIGALSPYTVLLTPHKDLMFNFINVASAWGDMNHVDKWVLRVTNLSSYYIPLIRGQVVATAVFLKNEDIGLGITDANFDIEELKKSWTPSKLLPTTYLKTKPKSQRQEINTEQQQPPPIQQQLPPPIQQQIQQQQQRHQQRVGTGNRKKITIPEPARDKEGNPILPTALQSVNTKKKSEGEDYIAPKVMYDPYTV